MGELQQRGPLQCESGRYSQSVGVATGAERENGDKEEKMPVSTSKRRTAPHSSQCGAVLKRYETSLKRNGVRPSRARGMAFRAKGSGREPKIGNRESNAGPTRADFSVRGAGETEDSLAQRRHSPCVQGGEWRRPNRPNRQPDRTHPPQKESTKIWERTAAWRRTLWRTSRIRTCCTPAKGRMPPPP